MRFFGVGALVLLAACVERLDVPTDDKIACGMNSDCPSGRTCNPTLKQCLLLGAEASEPSVAFISPNAGETGVSVTGNIVVAFNLDVDLQSLAALTHLASGDGTAVSVVVAATQLANTVTFTPQAALASLASYTFSIDPGVLPAPGTIAAPSSKPFSSSFVTGDAPDRTPPGAVSNIVINRSLPARADLSWTNPSDADFAGVLILREANAVVSELPVAGVTYATGAVIGNAEVVAFITGSAFSDVTISAGAYDYAFFAVDKSSNYAPAVRVPFVAASTLIWCPSETGAFSVTSPDLGTQQLQVGPAGIYPATADLIGAQTPIALGGTFVLGQSYSVRVVATNDNGSYVDAPQPFVTSDPNLLPLAADTPPGVPIGATASWTISPYVWPAFNLQVDTNVLPGAYAWSSTGVSISNGTISAEMALAGSFGFQVQPLADPSCAAAPWVQSADFSVGSGVRYVSTGGAGNGDDPTHPCGTISDVLAGTNGCHAVTSGTDVYVSAGTYNEVVTLVNGVRLFGGYATTFQQHDPPLLGAGPFQFTTTIAPIAAGTQNVSVVANAAMGASTVIDGFTIQMNPNANEITRAINIVGGASPTINNVRIPASVADASTVNCGIYIDQDSNAVVSNSIVYGPHSSSGAPTAIYLNGCGSTIPAQPTTFCAPTITGNHITNVIGIDLEGNAGTTYVSGVSVPADRPVIENNIIDSDPSSSVNHDVIGILCHVPGVVEVRDNTIAVQATDGSGNGASYGMQVPECAGHFEGNRVDGGARTGSVLTVGINVNGNNGLDPGDATFWNNYLFPIVFSNNFISSGLGKTANGVLLQEINRLVPSSQPYPSPLFFVNNDFFTSYRSNVPEYAIQLNNGCACNRWLIGFFENNLFFGEPGWQVISNSLPGGRTNGPTAFQNNVFLSLAPAAYEAVSYCGGTASPMTDIAEMECYQCDSYGYAANNVQSALAPSDVFVDPTGPDGFLSTLADNDWHLKTTDPSITSAGLNASQSVCSGAAYTGSDTWCPTDGATCPFACHPYNWPCGGVTLDKDGKARGTSYSVGAYQP